jgi:hypothetical protein
MMTDVIADAAGEAPTGARTAGAALHDTTSVTGVAGFTPTATITYSGFTNGTCSGAASVSHQVTLSGGVVPNSPSSGMLGAGSYAFEANYSGDTTFKSSVSAYEPFSVAATPVPPTPPAPPSPPTPVSSTALPITGLRRCAALPVSVR